MITEMVRDTYGLASVMIQNDLIKEEQSTVFSARFLHNFLATTALIRREGVIYHNDHILGYLAAYHRKENRFLIVGPFIRISFDNDNAILYQYMHQYHIPQKDQEAFFHFLTTLPSISEPDQKEILGRLYHHLTGTDLDPLGVLRAEAPPDNDYDRRFPAPEKADFINQAALAPSDLSEAACNEQMVNHYIESGDPDGLADYIHSRQFTIHTGILKDQFKNMHFSTISSITLLSRAAIRGGLDYSTAQHMLDLYVAYLDRLRSIDEIMVLLYQSTIDYATAVRDAKIPQTVSPAIRKVLRYIHQTPMENHSLTSIAKHENISSTYLSKLFSKEMGLSLSAYLQKKKIQEAQTLLIASDLPLAAISERLGFSSQGHFQNVFHKETGSTPGKYRKQHTIR